MLVGAEVIKRARDGDSAAFDEVAVAYRKRVVGMISRSITRPERAEHAAQEVFSRLRASVGQVRTPEVFEPWLYRLTVNAVYDHLRRPEEGNQ